MSGGQPGTTFPGSSSISGGQNPPGMGGLPQYGMPPGIGGAPQYGMPPGVGGLPQGPTGGGYGGGGYGPMGGAPMSPQPPMQGAPLYPHMGQFPPRQAGGPMGPPMVDPNSAGGFFGHPGMGFRGGNVRQ